MNNEIIVNKLCLSKHFLRILVNAKKKKTDCKALNAKGLATPNLI